MIKVVIKYEITEEAYESVSPVIDDLMNFTYRFLSHQPGVSKVKVILE